MSLGLKVLTGKWLEGKGIAEVGSLWHGESRFNMVGSRKLL